MMIMMIMMNFAVVPKSAWADLPMIQLYSPMNCIYCESENKSSATAEDGRPYESS